MENMLLPLSICGWAQLALTDGKNVCPATQTGSHFSWQSHSRLVVFSRLSKEQRMLNHAPCISINAVIFFAGNYGWQYGLKVISQYI